MRTVVAVSALSVGDLVDFGRAAVPPRIWSVDRVTPLRDGRHHVQWREAPEQVSGHPRAGRRWDGIYGPDATLLRVPEVVTQRPAP